MKHGERMRLAGLLIGISLPGIVLAAWQLPGMLDNLDVGLPPITVLVLVATIQSLVLVSAFAVLGVWIAPKVSLSAPVLEAWSQGRPGLSLLASQAKVALPAGFAIGLLMIAVEAAIFQPYLPDALYLLGTPLSMEYLLFALTYGGVVEEVLLRWGAMSLFAWIGFLVMGRRNLAWALVVGNALAAMLFGIAHLPAVGVMVDDVTAPIIVRTIVLNAVPAFVFGLLFQRRGLEAAMFAHMGAHLGMAVPRLIFGA